MPNAPYDFAAIEKKWQQIWEEEKTFVAGGGGVVNKPNNLR